MKVIYFLASLLLGIQAQAQQQTGRVVYEYTRQMQFRMSGGPGAPEQGPPPPAPRALVIKLEVLFGNNQMLRQALVDNSVSDFSGNENGVHIRAFGDDDITWINFGEGRKVEQKEFAAKLYLVSDSIRKQNWKLTGESRTILGYTCQQATTTRVSKRSMMSMDNGVMSRKEVPDTSQVSVWFTTAIPVPAGPDFEGQLPGLMLQIDINNNTTFKAIEISKKADIAAIKEPKKGKKLSADEFNKEREKAMADMQRNGGGRRAMHVGN